jgi:hypothetical protein
MRHRSSILRAAPLLAVALLGCGDNNGTPPAQGPIAIFAPPATGNADLTTLPWPSDLYLDSGGHVAIASLTPLQETPLHARLIADLANRDGFAVTTGAFFPVSAALDPAHLDVVLIDLEAKITIPVVTYFRAQDLLLHARPQNGNVLQQKHRYAWVVTSKTRGSDGNPLRASPDFQAAAASTRPSDPRLGRAWDSVKPALDAFAAVCSAGSPSCSGTPQVVAATTFTTQTITADLEAIRAAVAAAPAPKITVGYVFAASKMSGDDDSLDGLLGTPMAQRPGIDNVGGLAHDGEGWVIQGTFDASDWIAATSPSKSGTVGTGSLVGALAHGSDGKLMTQGIASVPFTLVLPANPPNGSWANVPAVVFTHGLGGDRFDVMAVANTMAKQGFATLGIDLPFHGMRLPGAVDQMHNGSGMPGPDGFVDLDGFNSVTDFFDIAGDPARHVAQFDPPVLRGAFQQSVSDLVALVRLITAGDFSAVATRDARLAGLSFRSDSVVYSGESFGSIIGGMVIAVEPKVGAATLSVGGGGLVYPLLTWSVVYGSIFSTLLEGALGEYASDDPPESDFGYNLFEYLLEPADPIGYARHVIREPLAGCAPRHVLLWQAYLDESVPNISNEALAVAMGLQPASVTAGGTPKYANIFPAPTVMPAPFSGNLMVGGKPYTAAIVQFQTATHGMMTYQKGQRTHDPTVRPFAKLPMPIDVDDPIDPIHAMYGSFASDWYAGKIPTVIDAK